MLITFLWEGRPETLYYVKYNVTTTTRNKADICEVTKIVEQLYWQ